MQKGSLELPPRTLTGEEVPPTEEGWAWPTCSHCPGTQGSGGARQSKELEQKLGAIVLPGHPPSHCHPPGLPRLGL